GRAIADCVRDMGPSAPMNRLLQGDVGSGKTAVAAALCHAVIREGMQSAMMAPTEILATQHYHSLDKLLAPAGIRVELLTGSVTPKNKKRIYSALESGEIQLIIGTHALLSEGVQFNDLALVITDEQHRFGVEQRSALAKKGNAPHLLVMSATPIPRTLALMIYGDLDISILDELPPGRQPIETYCIDSTKRLRAYKYIQKHLDEGRQGYMICPLVEQGENDLASVTAYKEFVKDYFPPETTAVLHGKMKSKEKDAVMSGFMNGEYKLLISTTVVEVGVDVPNAVIMLIENAEMYGLSQLHQLRGRIGRGVHQSTCILLTDAQNEEALSRMKVMCATTDGFKIADADLSMRGPGDFFGQRQHGLPRLKIADMMKDLATLREAQECAGQILKNDPTLKNHPELLTEINRLFVVSGNDLAMIL
ncbi:MAG: ATP-dependent DNA helicase RecG, partial [Oscillospiraceae bacterium]